MEDITRTFKVPRRDAVISFPEGHEYEGAEIKTKLDVDVRTFLEFQSVNETSSAKETKEMFSKFGDDVITGWNLVDDEGKAIPADAEGFLSLPASICIAIIGAWAESTTTGGKV